MNDSSSDDSIVFLGTEAVRKIEKDRDMRMDFSLTFFTVSSKYVYMFLSLNKYSSVTKKIYTLKN